MNHRRTEFVRDWLATTIRELEANAGWIGRLDEVLGDGDMLENLLRGLRASVAELDVADGRSVAGDLDAVGDTLVSTVGGTSGPLWASFFQAMSGQWSFDLIGAAAAFRSGTDMIALLGGAERGDKTILDALIPAVEALEAQDARADLAEGLRAAAQAAWSGADATKALQARRGRASYLGERSIGHQDPGAVAAAVLVGALAETLASS
jgi:dihydroxyacetone kinase-like protein